MVKIYKVPPRKIPTTGDDDPAQNIMGYTLRMSGRHQFFVCGVAVLIAGLSVVPIELQRRIIDDAITPGNRPLLIDLAAIYLAVVLAHQIVKLGLRIYQSWLSESAIAYTRNHLIGIYRNRESVPDEESGKAVSIIGREVDTLGQFIGKEPSEACANIAKLLAVVGYMLYVEPQIAAVGLLLLVPQAIVVPVMQQHLNMLLQQRLKYLRLLGEDIAAEPEDAVETGSLLRKIYDNHMAFYIWKFLMKSLLNLMRGLVPLAILVWGGWLVIDGQTTIGVVVAFISGIERIAGPIRSLLSFYRTVAQAQVQHQMIARWM